MIHNLAPIRPAMTALAVIIAASATPLFAQDASTAPAAPVVIAPPPPAIEPAAAPVSTQTATPDVTPVQAAPAPALEPMKTMSTPVEHTVDTPSDSNVASRTSTPAKHVAQPAAIRSAKPVETAAVTKAAPVETPAPAPVAAAPAAAPAPTPVAAAPAVKADVIQTRTTNDETLPIAGAIGLGVIALGGAAFAFSRKRREDEDELVLERAAVQPMADPVAEPVMVAPKAVAKRSTKALPDHLPNGFDMSRFGRHTRQAYLGPTPENPSLSLKRRLKHASFFDQREREAAIAGAPIAEPVVVKAAEKAPAKAAAKAEADNGQITVRMAPQRKKRGFSYALTR